MSIDFKQMAKDAILADGTIDDNEIKLLQKYLKTATGDEGLAFLIDLRNSYSKKAKGKGGAMSAAFEKFFFKTMNAHVMKEGKISSAGASYLSTTLFPGGKVDDSGYAFLSDLNKKAKDKSREFEAFMQDVDKKRAKAKK
jgi:hypothetical protein